MYDFEVFVHDCVCLKRDDNAQTNPSRSFHFSSCLSGSTCSSGLQKIRRFRISLSHSVNNRSYSQQNHIISLENCRPVRVRSLYLKTACKGKCPFYLMNMIFGLGQASSSAREGFVHFLMESCRRVMSSHVVMGTRTVGDPKLEEGEGQPRWASAQGRVVCVWGGSVCEWGSVQRGLCVWGQPVGGEGSVCVWGGQPRGVCVCGGGQPRGVCVLGGVLPGIILSCDGP